MTNPSKSTIILDKIINGGGESLLISLLESGRFFSSPQIVYIGKVDKIDNDVLSSLESSRLTIINFRTQPFLAVWKIFNSDVIYCYSIKTQIFYKLLSVFCNPSISVGHYHGDASQVRTLVKLFNRYTYCLMDKYIYTSETSRFSHENTVQKKSRSFIVHNGIDYETVSVKKTSYLKNKIKFISINRLENVKDIPKQLKIMRDFLKFEPNVSLDVIGDGSCREEIEELIKSLDLQGIVTLRGSIDHSILVKQINNYDVLLSTSINEGFGLNVAEALSADILVYVSDIIVYRELYSECGDAVFQSGCFFNDFSCIKEKLNENQRLGRNYVRDRYSLDKFIERMRSVFDDMDDGL